MLVRCCVAFLVNQAKIYANHFVFYLCYKQQINNSADFSIISQFCHKHNDVHRYHYTTWSLSRQLPGTETLHQTDRKRCQLSDRHDSDGCFIAHCILNELCQPYKSTHCLWSSTLAARCYKIIIASTFYWQCPLRPVGNCVAKMLNCK